MVLMTLVILFDVISRYVFNFPFRGTYELIEYAMVVVLSCAMAYTQVIRGHIDIESLVELFPRTLKNFFNWLATFIAFVYYALIAYYAFVKTALEVKTGTTSAVLYIVKYPFYFVVGVGFFVFTLVLLSQVLISKEPEGKKKEIAETEE